MTAIGKEGAEAAISMVVGQWHGRDVPKVRVVETIADIPERARRVVSYTDGAFDSASSTVYLVGDRIGTAKQARRTLAREVINHYSLMQILGGDFELRIADVIRLIESGDPKVSAIADGVRGVHGADIPKDVLAAKTLAGMAEQGLQRSALNHSIASVRRFLRGQGFRLSVSHTEARGMIIRAAANQ